MIISEGGLDEGKVVWLKGLGRRESGTNEGERQMSNRIVYATNGNRPTKGHRLKCSVDSSDEHLDKDAPFAGRDGRNSPLHCRACNAQAVWVPKTTTDLR